MNIETLTISLSTPDKQQELKASLNLLESKNYSGFFAKNQDLIRSILFVKSYAEFEEFIKKDDLNPEIFRFAFLRQENLGGAYES